MGRRRAALIALAATTTATLACATGGAVPRDDEAAARAWFGVRGVPCASVTPALGAAAWRMLDEGAWCAVSATAGEVGLRVDSTAQRVSQALGRPVLSFFVAGGAWSYTVFDRGEPVLSLESHLGAPLLTGDATRAATLLEVDAEVVADTHDEGRDAQALARFVAAVGLPDPSVARTAQVVDARVTPGPTHATNAPEDTLARIPSGTWAALPPLGVVLVKAVVVRTKDGVAVPTYVLVDDMNTLEVPVAQAEAMGMRPIASSPEVDAALKLVADGVEAPPREYDAKRVKGWLDAMGGGALLKIARVYAELCALRGSRKLFQVEDGLLSTSREWLAEEIATARQSQTDAVDALLRKACD